MTFLYDLIGYPFGWLMWLLYHITDNYLIDIIIFTVITKLILLPITIKQQKNTAKMTLFQPKLNELKKKYANNQQKYQEEVQNLYTKEGVNPASSCLPMILQMLLLFGIYDVVNKPLTHIFRMSKETVSAFVQKAIDLGCEISGGVNSLQAQLHAFNFFKQKPTDFTDVLDANTIETLKGFKLQFFGINFGEIPSWSWKLLILIPVLSGITSLISMLVSQAMNRKNNPALQNQGASMTVMMLFAPLMSFWIAFKVPAGVGFYWIVSNIFIIFQTIIISKIYTPEKLKELAQKEIEKAKEKRGVMTTTATVVDEQTGEEKVMVKEMSDAEKIAAARKRMAEKYGDD